MPVPYSARLNDFRISLPMEIRTLLGQMAEQNVLISLTAPRGITYTTTIWEVDRLKGTLCLGVEPSGRHLDRILAAEELLAVGYLDKVKIQFDVHDLMQVRDTDGQSVLTCRLPRELYRFQRRSHFRVRPLPTPAPVVRLRPYPESPAVELRIIDVSVSGVALLMSGRVPLSTGMQVAGADVELDADTRFVANLEVMNVSPLRQDVSSSRVGCEMSGLSAPALRALQRFINQTQKRRRAMAWADL
ncbi:hypothetical protein GCM10023144_32510 [Pigmentiphaga soli]|uniref:Flagellar brake protein YcgR n=1 Tax=Pigmentiphaga soli TaxID=1007095 RepID=A0ABP8HC23_9BURK